MILFAADRHYDQYCGRHLHEALHGAYAIDFHEDDWRCLEQPFVATTDLLMLNLVADTCGVPPPSAACEPHVRAYMESGKPVLLLHGGSAAFWPWPWWRERVGYRWVRGNDPDGAPPSTHPVRPYTVRPARSRHPLVSALTALDLPEDEIYTDLEQTCPCWTLMETVTDEGTFPMCYACTLEPGGGTLIGFLPGHRPDVVTAPGVVGTVRTLIDYLLGLPR